MNKEQSYLQYYDLDEWWLTTFTSEEREYIENVIAPEEDGSYLTKDDFCIVHNKSKLSVIDGIASYLTNENNSELYLKISGAAENLFGEVTAEELHHYYNIKIEGLRRKLRNWPDVYDLLKETCYKQIEISQDVIKYIKNTDPKKELPPHVGYTRLAIMLQKEKIHSEVVRICQKALDENWLGNWEKRINANKHKTDSPTKIVITKKPIKPKPAYNGSVPLLEGYFPSYENMNDEQKEFYKKITPSLKKGQYVDVEGNIGYIYVYLYKLMSNWKKYGYDGLYNLLLNFSELYAKEKKIKSSCLFWAYDCLLGAKKYEEYLEITAPFHIIGTKTHFANIRLNIQEHIGIDANCLDVMSLLEGRKSNFISNNQTLYLEKAISVLSEYASVHGGWFDILKKWSKPNYLYDHYLFSGSLSLQTSDFKVRAYYSVGDNISIYKELLERAENKAREELGVPLVGEGWVSESELYRKLKKTFSATKVVQHGCPPWLGRQHYDIWFPDWNVAVEYHGKQHFESVDFFGGEEAFKKTVERDIRKIKISEENNVNLIVVREGYDLEKLIEEISESRIY